MMAAHGAGRRLPWGIFMMRLLLILRFNDLYSILRSMSLFYVMVSELNPIV